MNNKPQVKDALLDSLKTMMDDIIENYIKDQTRHEFFEKIFRSQL